MWFKNAIIYRIPQYWTLATSEIEDALQPNRDKPIGSHESISHGWVDAHDGGLVYRNGQHILLKLRTHEKLLPASVIQDKVQEIVANITEREGYKPGRKQIKEIKEDAISMLLPSAFVVHKETPIWIDTEKGWLVIGTGSLSAAEVAVSMLIRSIDKLPLETLYLAKPIAQTLTEWLAEGEATHPFTVDQDAVLTEKSGNAQVRYSNHSLDGQDLQLHLQQGKQCTRLALTWKDRVSFALTEKATLTKIQALDILEEGREQDMDQFASDFALMTGELSELIDSLIEAFGGLAKQEKEAA